MEGRQCLLPLGREDWNWCSTRPLRVRLVVLPLAEAAEGSGIKAAGGAGLKVRGQAQHSTAQHSTAQHEHGSYSLQAAAHDNFRGTGGGESAREHAVRSDAGG